MPPFLLFLVELLKNLTFLTSDIMENSEKKNIFLKDHLKININIFLNTKDLEAILYEEKESKKIYELHLPQDEEYEEIANPNSTKRKQLIQKLIQWNKREYEPSYCEFMLMERMGLVERYYLSDIEIQQMLNFYNKKRLDGSKANDFECDWCGTEAYLNLKKIYVDGILCGFCSICKDCYRSYHQLKEKPFFSLTEEVHLYLNKDNGETL